VHHTTAKETSLPLDTLGRSLQDLRISVTDRCNLRCVYCMPKEIFGPDYPYLERSELLTYEEITRLTRVLADLGVRKVRLTGGEPLLRHGVERLIEMLTHIPDLDLTLTTNGALLTLEKAFALKAAGLRRITVSLDSLDEAVFTALNDVDFSMERALAGIENVAAAGLTPVKINMVVLRSVNLESVLPMARHFHGSGHILRFIEYMDVGDSNGWKLDEVVPAAELVALIGAELPLEPVAPNYRGEVARRWRYADGGGEIGLISSVSQPFCGDCTRVRLSACGELFTCLFASAGHDVRALLRSRASDKQVSARLTAIWRQRDDRYSELRSARAARRPRVEMSYIGG
jgi:cyclic pyranopterin phosphate synthase